MQWKCIIHTNQPQPEPKNSKHSQSQWFIILTKGCSSSFFLVLLFPTVDLKYHQSCASFKPHASTCVLSWLSYFPGHSSGSLEFPAPAPSSHDTSEPDLIRQPVRHYSEQEGSPEPIPGGLPPPLWAPHRWFTAPMRVIYHSLKLPLQTLTKPLTI